MTEDIKNDLNHKGSYSFLVFGSRCLKGKTGPDEINCKRLTISREHCKPVIQEYISHIIG